MYNIKTFQDACQALNLNPNATDAIVGLSASHQAAMVAHYKLCVIVEALNEGWTPDWNDEDQCKYYPWFYMHDGGGFGLSRVGCLFAISAVGSRLCFKNRELAEYAGTQFVDLYKEYFIK